MLVLDVETFQYDLLLGLHDPVKDTFEFLWNQDIGPRLKQLHDSNIPLVNYNGEHYDLPLLYNYFFNPRNKASWYQLSKLIVVQHQELKYPRYWNSIDLLFNTQNKIGLKIIEAIMGWEIRESSIDFDYPYKLTEEQRREVEYYNKQDLKATWAYYIKLKYYFECRIELCNFLNIEHDYSIPLPTLVGMGLGAHRKDNKPPFPISDKCINLPLKSPVKQIMLEQMNKPVFNFSLDFIIGDKEYTIANGGIHSKQKNWSGYDVYHVDAKGYYSLLMMNYGLFSRNLPPSGIEAYNKMYWQRLEYAVTAPIKSDSYKLGLLAIWGATRNRFHILYDPYVGALIPLYGELFLIWLIELYTENGIEIINANTDGLVVKGDINKINEITKMWEDYGNFKVKTTKYKRIVQKDINNYIIGNSLETLKYHGRDFTAVKPDWLFSNIVLVPQAPIISKLLSYILFYGEEIDPELYVREHIRDYKVADYMFIIHHTMKFTGMHYAETKQRIQRCNRAYASINGYQIEKVKDDDTWKYPGLPLCEICNEDLSKVDISTLNINYEWYIDEIMRRYVTYL
jgi:hypothetical protein